MDKDYFAVVLEGLQIEDETELRALGFFSELQQRTNLKFDVGSWEDIEAHQLPDLIQTIDKLHPGSTTGELGNLLAALRKMAVTAQEEGCFLSFML